MFDLVFRNTTRDRAYSESFFKKIIEATLATALAGQAKPKAKHLEFSVTLVGEKKIRDLNRTYRRKDAVTDVLSFPLGETPVAGYTSNGSGDLFLCLSYARAKAKREGVSLKRMMAWMTVHGTLHLLGYDHERSSKDEKKMFALERTILEKF